jgi:plasmid maintenance system antidote protein VapI
MPEEKMAPVHPGEILQELFISPLGLSQNAPNHDFKVAPCRVNEIGN